MAFKPPQNAQMHDLVLVLNGSYISYGKDLGLRFKLVMFTIIYHSVKPAWAKLLGGFPDAISSIKELREVLNELEWLVRKEESTQFTYDYGVYLGERLRAEEGTREMRRTLRAGIEFYIDYIAGLDGLKRSYSDVMTDVDPQLSEMLGKMRTWDISGVDIHQENRELRELLAFQIGGMTLYRDDGELSDSSAHPSIDFRRDTPTLIKRALIRRAELAQEAKEKT